jgi:hypothetical protein
MMQAAPRRSFGYARVRALKSGLMTADDGARLVAHAPKRPLDSATRIPLEALYAPVVETWRRISAGYPRDRELFVRLLRTHEIENVKLILRAAIRGRSWTAGCWRPLGSAASLFENDWLPVPAVRDLARRFARTPYADIITGELDAHGGDLQAIELGLDRWVSDELFAGAAGLGSSESRARALVLALVRERDLALVARATAYGLTSEMAFKLTTVVRRESRSATRVPAFDWPARLEAARRARRRACHLAFVGEPFGLAPPLALLLLRLDEVEIVLRLAEARTPDRIATLTRDLPGG